MATKAVIDSNVWLSAALSPDGKPAQIVHYILTPAQAADFFGIRPIK